MAGRLANLLHSRTPQVGRTVARLLCVVLAILGALPPAAALALHSRAVTDWITAQTQTVLRTELGLEASYTLEQRLWPLGLRLTHLRVPSNDGGPDALRIDEIVVRPRLLSLLSGNLEAGAIEIVNPRARLVFQNGGIHNVNYRLPQSKGGGKPLRRAPFSTLTVRGAVAELEFGDVSAHIGATDLDLVAGPELAFSASLRTGESRSTWVRAPFAKPGVKVDMTPYRYEDVLCSAQASLRYSAGRVEVDHLSIKGIADSKSERDTRPKCPDQTRGREEVVSLTLDDASLDLSDSSALSATGSLEARAPLWLANRFARMPPLLGSVEVQANGRYSPQSRLPELSARVQGRGLGLDRYHIARHFSAAVLTQGTHIVVPRLELGIANGVVVLHDTLVEPFTPGIPVTTRLAETSGMTFPGLMRDLGVTEHTIIGWNFGETLISGVHGTLNPLHLDAEIDSNNDGFAVYDRSWNDPTRRTMIAVPAATVRGRLGVRPNAFEFYDTTASFGTSSVLAELVSIGFTDRIEIRVGSGSSVELADIGPLVGIPISGRMDLETSLEGSYADPLLLGTTSVRDFVFGGFPIGNIDRSVVRFRPLWLEFEELEASKGASRFRAPLARLDFDTDASVAVDAHVISDALDLRDFFAIWHLDEDPRWDGIEAMTQVNARVRYALGGRNDPCGTGHLEVDGKLAVSRALFFGEHYDTGSASLSLDWNDMDAKAHGMTLSLSGMTLRKGKGTLLGSFSVSPGALVTGHAVATSVALADIDGLGKLRNVAEGTASGFIELSGRLDALEAHATASISELRVRDSKLPASELQVSLAPAPITDKPISRSACGGPIYPPFDRARYDRDPIEGTFIVSGQLFGGQVRFERLSMTQQREPHTQGEVAIHQLDIGSFARAFPALRGIDVPLDGSLTGRMAIKDFTTKTPTRAEVEAEIESLWLGQGALRVELLTKAAKLSLSNGTLRFPELKVGVGTFEEPPTILGVHGQLSRLDSSPRVEATLELEPFDISRLTKAFPQIERAQGRVTGALTAIGPLSKIRYAGKFQLESGELVTKNAPWAFTGVRLVVALDDDQIRVVDGRANLGNGTLLLTGSASLDGMIPKDLRLELQARSVHAPLQPGIEGTMNADLVAAWQNTDTSSVDAALPSITGSVDVLSFAYTRPISMSVDISDLTRRGKRTEFDSYDPSADRVRFDVQLLASRPLRIRNNLLEAEVDIAPEGLRLQGTNQRIGLVGKLNVKPGGRLVLRDSEFEVRNGSVRFTNPSQVEPQVDFTATTEYRRYSDSFDTSPDAVSNGGGTANATGGRWLVTMHAYGDAEELKVDLSSDPVLAQDDIFLLLAVGVTRAELDQSQSASVGESVALEALGHLSGADQAVSRAIPVIDEFRFGSAYSSKAGRTEPTVTIGKRLAERIRASVTTGVAESREVRSKLEWRLSPRLSLEGTYDNVNDISSSALGNVGSDLRWRIEFE